MIEKINNLLGIEDHLESKAKSIATSIFNHPPKDQLILLDRIKEIVVKMTEEQLNQLL